MVLFGWLSGISLREIVDLRGGDGLLVLSLVACRRGLALASWVWLLVLLAIIVRVIVGIEHFRVVTFGCGWARLRLVDLVLLEHSIERISHVWGLHHSDWLYREGCHGIFSCWTLHGFLIRMVDETFAHTIILNKSCLVCKEITFYFKIKINLSF